MAATPENLGFLEWIDPYKWTERATAATRAAFKAENSHFKKILHAASTQTELRKLAGRIRTYEKDELADVYLELPTQAPEIAIRFTKDGYEYEWKWIGGGTWTKAIDIDIGFWNGVAHVAYTADGYNDDELHVKTRKSAWKYAKAGAANIAILNDRVYFIESDSPLKYFKVISLSLETGGNRRLEYKEPCHEIQLTLVRTGGGVFLQGSRSGVETLFAVTPTGVRKLAPDAISFFPVGCGRSGEPMYFYRNRLGSPWKLRNCSWKLSDEIVESGIEFCSHEHNCIVTKAMGVRTLWHMSSNSSPKRLLRGFFSMVETPRSFSSTVLPLWVRRPGRILQGIVFNRGSLTILSNPTVYADTKIGVSRSLHDGRPVEWLALCKPSMALTKSKGLLCIAYGAYGIPLSLTTARWRVWLDAGWCVALLFIRGGGDDNPLWANLGRLGGKLQGIDDAEACIRDLQRLTGCGPDRTCIYGRSAGGLVVGNMVARHPSGRLVGNAYTEVPYVDVLKTAANPALPLTEYEYDEFGNPRRGPAEFEQTLRISPIHMLGPEGAPGVNVLCRSGTHDMQVFPYESLKWILTLRGSGGARKTEKVLFVDSEGHTSSEEKRCVEQAEDFAILSEWIRAKNSDTV